jgi:hypothetical protein
MFGAFQGMLVIALRQAIEERTPWKTILPESTEDQREQRERIGWADAKRITDDLRAAITHGADDEGTSGEVVLLPQESGG